MTYLSSTPSHSSDYIPSFDLTAFAGMMDTVLNLGLNDKTVEALAKKSGDRRFAFDSYRRFVQMYSDVVLGIEINHFEKHLERAKEKRGVKQDMALIRWETSARSGATKPFVRWPNSS